MHDIAEFLSAQEPFSGLDEADLEELSRRVEVEFFASGNTILAKGERPQERIRVIRRGAVDLLDEGRVLDELGEGEMFGHPSMFSGLPTGFEVRAAEDTLCYAIGADDVLPLLARPAGLRFLSRTILSRPKTAAASVDEFDIANQSAAALVGEQPVIADPGLTVAEAVQRMESEGAGSVVVKLDGGGLGIVTDKDLRSKLIAAGRGADVPVSEVMSAPAHTVGPEGTGAELMLVMLDHGIHHVPVVDGRSTVVGVVRNIDLLAAQTSTPFMLRRAIADAADAEELGRIVRQMNDAVVALHGAGIGHRQVSSIISVVVDALTRRMIDLAVQEVGPPPAEFAWLSLGSDGRREAVPSSDVDSGLAFSDESEREPKETLAYMQALANSVGDSLKQSGWKLDAHGVTASGDFSCRAISDWRRAMGSWLKDPEDNKVLIATSIMLDARVVCGPEELDPKPALFETEDRMTLERWMLKLALAAKPPTGFMRDIVVEHTGEHRGTFDVKHGGLLPVVDIARYAGLRTGATVTSTVERLRAAGQSGALDEAHARTLEEAFDLFMALRLEHQVHQLERGDEPDDRIDPRDLNPLTRRYLRDAFREVAAVQKALAGGLQWGA